MSPAAAQSPEWADLLRRARAGIARQALLRAIGPYRPLLDPAASARQADSEADVLALLESKLGGDPEFFRRHPYARQLLRQVEIGKLAGKHSRPLPAGKSAKRESSPMARARWSRRSQSPRTRRDWPNPWASPAVRRFLHPTTGDLCLADLVKMLAADASMNVVVDYRALNDALVDPEEPTVFRQEGHGRMSLGGYVQFALGQWGLTLVEEPHRLLITTIEKTEEQLTTEVYPVGDLLLSRPATNDALLRNPYLDYRLAAQRRIRDKLQQPIDVDIHKKPLPEVARQLSERLDCAVLLDTRAIEEMGIVWRSHHRRMARGSGRGIAVLVAARFGIDLLLSRRCDRHHHAL